MNQLLVASATLAPHVALTCRIIRADSLLRSYLRWLTQPSPAANVPLMPPAQLLESVNSLTELARMKSIQPPSIRRIGYGLWFSSAIAFAMRRNSKSAILNRLTLGMLASSLLPLYRAPFAGDYSDFLDHTRNRLKDLLLLSEIIHQLQLTDLFEHDAAAQTSPQTILLQSLQIDLSQISRCLDYLLPQFDEEQGEFDFLALTNLPNLAAEGPGSIDVSPQDWDSADTLWQLASQLNSPSPAISVPRSWLQPSVDWARVSEQWMQLRLSIEPLVASPPQKSPSAVSPLANDNNIGKAAGDTQRPPGQAVAVTAGDEKTVGDTPHPMREELTGRELTGDTPHPQITASTGGEHDDAYDQTRETSGNGPTAKKEGIQQYRKFAIGEIIDLQDTSFLGSIRNQLTFCRRERRAMSLALIELFFGDWLLDNMSHDESGIMQRQWRQKLVEWLVEQGGGQNSTFLITASQQLVVSMVDCERHEMTLLVRSGLNQLQGRYKRRLAEQQNPQLGYHVGIASTPKPSINLDAGDIVHSARRCLESARKMGRETVKSIEVF